MQPSLSRRFTPLNILFFLIGLGLLFGLLTQVDFTALFRQVLGIPWPYFLLGGLLYILKALTRAWRFQRLNRLPRGAYPDMLRLVLASSLGAQLLPFKLGEFAYVYLLKRSRRAPITQGLSSLLVARIFDLLGVALLFVLLAPLLGFASLGALAVYFNAILVFIALMILLIVLLLVISRAGGGLLDRFFQLPILARLAMLEKVRAALRSLLDQLARYSPRDYAEYTGLSLLEWFVNFWAFHVLLVGLGLQPTFFATVVCVTFAALASVLPINSFGSFGTQEAGWPAGLVLLGYPRETAISSGFAAHLLTLAYMLLLGGLSWLSYLLPEKGPTSGD